MAQWLKKEKNPPAMEETRVDPWVVKIPWRRRQPTPVILPWVTPCTEEPDGLQSMGLQKSQTRLSDWTTRTIIKAGRDEEGCDLVLHDYRVSWSGRWCEQQNSNEPKQISNYCTGKLGVWFLSCSGSSRQTQDARIPSRNWLGGGNLAVDRSSNGTEL